MVGGYYVIDSGKFDGYNDFEVVLGALAWIVGLEVFSRVAGWIVRGFMGVPSGKDMLDNSVKDSEG